LLSNHGAQKYYALTTSLFFFGGLTSWSFIEWIFYSKRLQKRLDQQDKDRMLKDKEQMLKELMVLRQQLRERLQQVSNLIEEREKHADELARDQHNEDERIQELEQAIAQLESQRSTPVQQSVSVPTDLEQNQELLQTEIQQRERTIADLQSQISAQSASNSGKTQALEALQNQLQAMRQQQASAQRSLEQYEQDLAQLRQEAAQHAQEKSNLINVLKKQLQDAQQETIEAEQRRAALEQSVVALNQQKEQDSAEIDKLGQAINDLEKEKIPTRTLEREHHSNEFESLVLHHLATSPKVQSGEWRVLANFDVSLRRRDRQFTDFLVIGQACMFVIEAKSYRGTIHAEGDAKRTQWYSQSWRSTAPQEVKSAGKRNPYEQVNAYRDSLRSKLSLQRTNGEVEVYGIVVFPKGAEVSTLCSEIAGCSRVSTSDYFIQVMQNLEVAWNRSSNEKSVLSPQQIEDLLCGRPVLKRVA
jgi:hypothetical protein